MLKIRITPKAAHAKNPMNRFIDSVASYFSKADDGQNDSDKDQGGMFGMGDQDTTDVRDGEWSGNPRKTGDGSGNEFNKPEKEEGDIYMNGGPRGPSMGADKVKKEEGYIESNPPATQGSDKDIISDENTSEAATDENDDPSLDKTRKKAGMNIVIPPYNKDASPETDPDKKVPNYEPPTRDDITAKGIQSEMFVWVLSKSAEPEENAVDKPGETEDKACMGRDFSQKKRDKMPSGDFAGPHESFPIEDEEDVHNAKKLAHKAKNPSQVEKNIERIAHKKGLKG